MKQLLTILFISFTISLSAQTNLEKQKVLFVLDASGSMEVLWGNETKMEIAKKTLYQLVDSIEKNNPNIEVALRIFGHQHHKSLNNCQDSKLEVPFAQNNSLNFKKVLSNVKAQGHTPIAYSLMKSANDFIDNEAINSIILITDGLENCNGNTCEAALFLKENRITINPFIIGLDIADSLINSFDCIGTFINAKDYKILNDVLQKTVLKATGKTTLSIHFKSEAQQTISNTAFSIFDAVNHEIINTYIHSLRKNAKPDTLVVDPRGFLQIKVYTYPSLLSESFQLKPGTHNDVIVQLPKSYIDFNHKIQYDDKEVYFYLRQNNTWVYNNSLHDLPILSGQYQINTNFTPLENEVIIPKSDKVLTVKYPATGKLSINNNKEIIASIYNENWKLIKDISFLSKDYSLKLLPGKYHLVYIEKSSSNSENTHQHNFEIYEERTTLIQLF